VQNLSIECRKPEGDIRIEPSHFNKLRRLRQERRRRKVLQENGFQQAAFAASAIVRADKTLSDGPECLTA
jgi:hypothetical protein